MQTTVNGQQSIKQKKRIENRYNVWLYRLILCLTFFVGYYFSTGLNVNMVITQINYIFAEHSGPIPYAFEYILRFIIAVMQVVFVEIVARILFYVVNTFTIGALTMSLRNFVATARVFVILQNLIFAVLSIALYFFNFFIPFGLVAVKFVVTTGVFALFFAYINKHYLDPKVAHRAFRMMASFYLIYSLSTILSASGVLQ